MRKCSHETIMIKRRFFCFIRAQSTQGILEIRTTQVLNLLRVWIHTAVCTHLVLKYCVPQPAYAGIWQQLRTGSWGAASGQQQLLLIRKQQQQFRRSVAKGYRLDMMLL